MALYAIGDIQGCDTALGELLTALRFSPDRDQIWFVGDLVNRGPESLAVLRRIRALGKAAVAVLGNHDLHLLSVSMGKAKLRNDDTLDAVLSAPDRTALLEWLRSCPLLYEEPALQMAMVHAGLAPQWDMQAARRCAREFETALQRDPENLFDHLYGDQPDAWDEALAGEERLRYIANCFTRMRFVDAAGRLMLRAKGAPKKADNKFQGRTLIPWFEAPNARWRGVRLVFGHWSTLGFFRNGDVIGLDTGCVWGNRLTALRLDSSDAVPVQVACAVPKPAAP
jgi:bis(5'-nucleosyl)-tetraphosphatase (symmetrical)